jgi:hypothetical protein
MVLEIVIDESTIRNVLIVIMWALIIIAIYVLYKINPTQTFFMLMVVCAILTVWIIQWAWGTYIAPLYSITVVP